MSARGTAVPQEDRPIDERPPTTGDHLSDVAPPSPPPAVALGGADERSLAAGRGQVFRLDDEAQKELKLHQSVLGSVPSKVEGRAPRTGRLLALALAIVPRVTLDELGTHAGAITYGALFSIPPLLLLSVSLSDVVVRNSTGAEEWVFEHVVDLVPGLESLLDLDVPAASGRAAFGVIGGLTLVWAATGLASRVRHALGIVHRTAVTGLTVGHVSGLVAQVPLGLGLLLLLVAASGLAVLSRQEVIGSLLHTLGYGIIVVLGVLFWTAAYWLLSPRRCIGFRGLLLGGAFFSVCFSVIERVGTWHVTVVSARYSNLYGAIGSVLAILALLYVMSWAFLLGAEINQVVYEQRRSRVAEGDL